MRVLTFLTAALAAGLAVGCGARAPSPGRPPFLHSPKPPVQVYATLAREVRSCWFAPARPLLAHHIFRAEAAARGEPDGETRIIIYEEGPDGRLGLTAYSIRLIPRRKGTRVATENHRLPEPLAQKLTADVGFWLQDGQGCGGAPAPAPAAPGR